MYDTVSRYYEAQIQSKLSVVEEQSRPIEERHAEIMEVIDLELKKAGVFTNPKAPDAS